MSAARPVPMRETRQAIDDLPAFCERELRSASGPIYGKHGLTALNLCNTAENRGYVRPSKRSVELALATLNVVRRRMWHSTWYRLEAGPDGR